MILDLFLDHHQAGSFGLQVSFLLGECLLENIEDSFDAEVPSGVKIETHGTFENRKISVETLHPWGANLILEKVRQTFIPIVHLVLSAGTAEEDATTGLDDSKESSVVEFLMRILASGIFVDPIFHLIDTLLDASVHHFGGVFEGVAVENLFGSCLL